MRKGTVVCSDTGINWSLQTQGAVYLARIRLDSSRKTWDANTTSEIPTKELIDGAVLFCQTAIWRWNWDGWAAQGTDTRPPPVPCKT